MAGERPMSLLVLGGARSGKSAYAQTVAETLARDGGTALLYVATAQAFDAEMTARIAAHRAQRDARWRTLDAPFDLPQALASATSRETVVLVDCLTLWLSNVFLRGDDAVLAGRTLTNAVAACEGPLILVTNEVGAGIVPDTPLGRHFRDAQGRLNQAVAAACDHVVLVSAGLPLALKPRDPPRFAP